MAELSAEAPLAKFESDDWCEYSDYQTADVCNGNGEEADVGASSSSSTTKTRAPPSQTPHRVVSNKILDNVKKLDYGAGMADNFGCETIGGSLEDLVNTFDDKITKCFRDLDENVETLAPVQIRSQDDVINECPMWWTLTGNYGNILPIDWSKSTARRLQLPTLQLRDTQVARGADEVETLSDEDEAVASDLDLHALIAAPHPDGDADQPPVPSAEQVIKEIDDLIDDDDDDVDDDDDAVDDDDDDGADDDDVDGHGDLRVLSGEAMHHTPDTPDCPIAGGGASAFRSPISQERLDGWGVSALNELLSELEWSVQHNSETLIAELALRDELEFEKELKNTFISLLLNVQNKRRQVSAAAAAAHRRTLAAASAASAASAGRNGNHRSTAANAHLDAKYITTVIPYHQGDGPPTNATLQVLIKILRAIVEDSPTVPTLLTDYILRVLCPT